MTITDAELMAWLQHYFWTFTRIGGVLMSAPVLGARLAPARTRLMLALALTLIMTPLLPAPPALEMFAAAWWLATAQQLLIGVVIGFVLQLVFEAVMLGGELIASSMGLSFAQIVDPARGGDAPVLGQLLSILATLLFLAMNGHLTLIEALHDSFRSLPVGGAALGAAQLAEVARWSGVIFAGGMRVALPVLIALLLVNMAFGVMSRATPSLNLQSVGFPISLVAGMLLLQFSLPGLQLVFGDLLAGGWQFLSQLLQGR